MITRAFQRIDAALLAPGSARVLFATHTALAAIIGLRLATRDWTEIAERPAVLTSNLTVMSWFPAEWSVVPVLVGVQIVGLVGVGMVLARWRPRFGFGTAWLAYLILTSLWGSSGKVMHNDVLTVLVAFVFVFAAVPGRGDSSGLDARWGWPPRVGLAVLGTIYFFTGFQKLRTSGLDWVFSENMQWVIRQGSSPFGSGLNDFVADHLWLTQMLSGGALALELLAPLLLAWRWTRGLFALAVTVMHGSIWMFLGLDYSAWVLTVAAVAIPSGIAALRTVDADGVTRWRAPIARSRVA